MAFSVRKREIRKQQSESGLLDAVLMQNLQDRFCDANNLYLSCLSKKSGVVTKAYGSRDELTYIHGLVTMDMHVALMTKLMDDGAENVADEDCGSDYVKMSGVSITVGGETAATWIVIGIMEDAPEDIPAFVQRTTPDRYYKSIQFLEMLSKQMFAVKMDEIIAQEAFLKSRESEAKMEVELHRNEVMTSIVQMLESEDETADVLGRILREACTYLDISTGALLYADQEGDIHVDAWYRSPDGMRMKCEKEHYRRDELPFFNGKPYMISANSMMPDDFLGFFGENGVHAGIFLPVGATGAAGESDADVEYYLCFCEQSRDRTWDVTDTRFVSDVKKIVQSILVRRAAQESLEKSYAVLTAVIEHAGCGICVRGMSGGVLYKNERFDEIFQKSIENGHLDEYLSGQCEDDSALHELYVEDEGRWIDYQGSPLKWVDGRDAVLFTVYDVSERKRDQQKIERQANNDFLTGLYNRMRCEQDLDECIKETMGRGESGALLYLDLDDFKQINDGLGHPCGDMLLKAVSNGLKEITEVADTCYRIGGDEFIVLVAGSGYEQLPSIVKRMMDLFSKPWELDGNECYCTTSVGAVRFPADGKSADELIRKADFALHAAKTHGKNRVEFYSGEMGETSLRRVDLEKNMRNATYNSLRGFEVFYQPIVDIQREGSPCIGAEALIRWHSDELGFLSPSEFIPMAEYLGLINPIGDFVMREAMTRCRRWNDSGHPEYKVNVNLSVVQLLQNDIVDKVRSVIQETGVNPHNVTLEVTESLAINDMTRMKQILGDIRALGTRIALDDFGTGYSSLNHIREIPLDVIKIDRCFIIDIGTNEFSNAFVRMVSELAGTIGVAVCVEGVETEEQLLALRDKKVQMIQGYYFGRPMTVDEFEKRYL